MNGWKIINYFCLCFVPCALDSLLSKPEKFDIFLQQQLDWMKHICFDEDATIINRGLNFVFIITKITFLDLFGLRAGTTCFMQNRN